MDETQVEAGRERVRTFRRHATLGRHPRVPERVGAVEVDELELLREHLGQADVLVDLDHAAGTHDPEVAPRGTHATLRLGRLCRNDDHRVCRAHRVDLAPDRSRNRPPVLAWNRRVERQLRHALRHRVAVDRDAGTVRAPVTHLREHRDEVHAEALLDLRRLREQPDDSAHVQALLVVGTEHGTYLHSRLGESAGPATLVADPVEHYSTLRS